MTHASRSIRCTGSGFAWLLWAALLLATQTLSLAHAHAEAGAAPDTGCAACSLAKADIASSEPAGRGAPPPLARWLPAAPQAPLLLPAGWRPAEPRGPPRI